MMNAVSSLKGFELQAEDGSLGTVSDFLFDDSSWKVRWMVVDTRRWLTGRKVLIHPSSAISAVYGARELNVALTKAQVEDSPDIRQDRPVSRQMQNDLYGYYGGDLLWGGGMFGGFMYGGGMGPIASPVYAPAYFGTSAVREAERDGAVLNEGDPQLSQHQRGFRLPLARDRRRHRAYPGLLIDKASWGIRYLIVDTSNWWFGQHVLISPFAVKGVDWSERHVRHDIARDRVKSSPPWNPAEAMNDEYEQRLHAHDEWPGYGW